MLPYFFRHYDDIVDRYFIFDNGSTDGSLSLLNEHQRVELSHFEVRGDSFVEEERHLGNSVWRHSDADWVIVTDIDEHIYHPNLNAYLQRCADQGITAIQSIGYEMVSNAFPTSDELLTQLVTTGTRSIGHNRLCIFNPKELTETNFNAGRHRATPTGNVVWPSYPEVLLLHYKQLGTEYPVARSAELRQGLRPGDLNKQWGLQYTWTPEQIIANWQQVLAASGPVPGLGILKHIEPAKYFEDEQIVHQSGLFDAQWYLTEYPDVSAAGSGAFAHYCNHGWRERRRPNFYFSPEWYSANYPALCTTGRNPFCDFVEFGEKRNARPSPFFDTQWYREQYGLGPETSPLLHYLGRRSTGQVSPLPSFDVMAFCKKHPEVVASGNDLFEEYSKRFSEY
jgi:hypothetical protein